jgi:FtsH-binding integral membrane protein
MSWRSWMMAVIGAWFVSAPWVLGVAHFQYVVWTSVILGLIQLVVSVWAALDPHTPSWRMWQYWVALLTGLWFVVEPFLGTYEEGQFWATAAPALLTIALAVWCLMEHTGWRQSDRPGSKT